MSKTVWWYNTGVVPAEGLWEEEKQRPHLSRLMAGETLIQRRVEYLWSHVRPNA